MPPRRSAATAPRAGSGSASRSGVAGSGAASAPSLPAALLSGYKRLPEIEAGLFAAMSSSPADTAAGSAATGPASPPQPTATAAMAAMRRWQRERYLQELHEIMSLFMALPRSEARTAAGVAELVSNHPAETAALLRLAAAGLREGTEDQAASSGGGWCGGGGGGGGNGSSQHQEYANVASAIALMIMTSIPLPASRHALGVLRFARALLATQPFHALARRLAASAPAGPSGGGAGSSGAGPSGAAGGGANRAGPSCSAPSSSAASSGPSGAGPSGAGSSAAATDTGYIDTNLVLQCFCTQFTGLKVAALDYDGQLQRGPNGHGAGVPVMPPGLAAEVAAERAACAEECARALAESGVVEHAARAMLLLQAQARALQELDARCASGVVQCLSTVWRLSEPASNAVAGSLRPSTTVLLRSALGGRCLRTAVLVYGIGTLRVIDRSPSYGVPAALQTAGLALIEPGKGPCPDTDALRLMLGLLAYGPPLPPPGRGASLALALRTARAAAGSLVGGRPMCLFVGVEAPRRPATPLPSGEDTQEILLDSLRCARALLPARDTSPRLTEQRREWWWLAGWAVCEASALALNRRRRLWGLVAEPLLAVWPDGCLDLDALPPAAPPEVAAALAGGLLSQLSRFTSPARADAATSLGLGSATTELFAACCEGGGGSGAQGATGFTLFLAPLLAYGDVEESRALLRSLGALAGLGAPSPAPPPGTSSGVREDGAEQEAAARQAAALLRDLGGALRGRGRTEEQGAGPSASAFASASASASAAPAQRLERMAAHASGLWGLPLGA